MDTELWLPVPGYEDIYEVSDLGRVRRIKAYKQYFAGWMLRPSDAKGYDLVCLARDGQRRYRTVHSIVAAAFIGPRPKGFQINHMDGNKKNNRPGNLEYVTPRQNTQHAVDTGLLVSVPPPPQVGAANYNTKLDPERVREIRRLYAEGLTGYGPIAERFGITKRAVAMIVKRISWKHVD